MIGVPIDRNWFYNSELDPHNRMLAVLETKAHLDLLAANGRIERRVVDGRFQYVPAGDTTQ